MKVTMIQNFLRLRTSSFQLIRVSYSTRELDPEAVDEGVTIKIMSTYDLVMKTKS